MYSRCSTYGTVFTIYFGSTVNSTVASYSIPVLWYLVQYVVAVAIVVTLHL